MAFMADIANIGFAEHQLFANVCHVASIAQKFEIPTAVDGVSIQASTYQLVVANDQFFIHPLVGIAQYDFFSRPVRASHKVARAE